MDYKKLTAKKKTLDGFRPLPKELVRNLDDWFKIELTYTSNALEGNTLTRRETAVVVEKGLTIGGKSLREHLEATNHAHALDFIYSLIKKKPKDISENHILTIHEIILKGTDDEHAGRYRNVPVRISGSTVIMPNPRKVPSLMENFQTWLNTKQPLHPVALAAEAHYQLVTIHPFVDGNGRTARLLMNLLLLMFGYPPAIIRKKDRIEYIGSLEKAQLGGSKKDYEKIIFKAAERSLDIYINTVTGKSVKDDLDSETLLKIGDLAKATNEPIATIRHWNTSGLLDVTTVTESGYQLFSPDMIQRCKTIQKLKSQRLSLKEIKEKLGQ
jgi:Fic family protein